MKVKAHYHSDWLGGWDFEFGHEVDIPKEVLDRYNSALKEYEDANTKLKEVVEKCLNSTNGNKR